MRIVRPIAVTPDTLVSSSVPESEPVWASGTTYAKEAQVRGSMPETAHTVYESLADSNVGHAVTDLTYWLPIGPTNRWRMFDKAVQSQTEAPEEIEVTFLAPTRVDSLALLNLSAASVQVTVTDPAEGMVYDETFSLVSTDGIVDWFSYFYEPIERRNDLVVMDLPPYSGVDITVSIQAPGGDAKAGGLIAGLSREIGIANMGARVGIMDYSRKERDDFGNFNIVERAFSKRASFTITMDSGLTDQVASLLARYRAQPLVYVGSDRFDSTIVYGFYRDFQVEIAGPNHSVCSLELEGLA